MSAPVRNDGVDDPGIYAPRWARPSRPPGPARSSLRKAPSPVPKARSASPPVSERISIERLTVPRISDAPSMAPAMHDSPPMAPGIGGPNIELPPPPLRLCEQDLAVRELRRRLSLDPNVIPQPPVRTERERAIPWIARLSLIVIFAAAMGFGVTLLSVSHPLHKQTSRSTGLVGPRMEDLSRSAAVLQPARLVIETQRGFANEPLPLGVWLNDSSGSETLTMVGLATGTKLSAGTPLGLTGWQVPARDLGKAFAYAPRDFVGVMDAAIDLRSRDRLIDSQTVRLEWVQRKDEGLNPAAPSKPGADAAIIDHRELVAMIKRGEEFLSRGDIPSARIALRRAAGSGNAQAALTMGMTFDPVVLSEHGVIGFAPDVVQARTWYQRARELGSYEASHRLEWLAKLQ